MKLKILSLILVVSAAMANAHVGVSFGFHVPVPAPVVVYEPVCQPHYADDYYLDLAHSRPHRLVGQPIRYNGRCYSIVEVAPWQTQDCNIMRQGVDLVIERMTHHGIQTRTLSLHRDRALVRRVKHCHRRHNHSCNRGRDMAVGAVMGGVFGGLLGAALAD